MEIRFLNGWLEVLTAPFLGNPRYWPSGNFTEKHGQSPCLIGQSSFLSSTSHSLHGYVTSPKGKPKKTCRTLVFDHAKPGMSSSKMWSVKDGDLLIEQWRFSHKPFFEDIGIHWKPLNIFSGARYHPITEIQNQWTSMVSEGNDLEIHTWLIFVWVFPYHQY